MDLQPETRIPRLFRVLARMVLRVLRWKIQGQPPVLDQYVLIIAPHTSHWDAIIWMAALLATETPAHWLAKSSIFIGPWGWLLRRVGGIPIERNGNGGVVESAVRIFHDQPQFVLGIAPEGTRSYQPHWHRGFYEIAVQANVPIVPCSADFSRRLATFGEPFLPSGDAEADMEIIRSLYATAVGKIPENQSLIQLK